MVLDVGSRIAHYDVTALIGEGGMGEVYQATDTKLNRQVALGVDMGSLLALIRLGGRPSHRSFSQEELSCVASMSPSWRC